MEISGGLVKDMDLVKRKGKKGLVIKTWERCASLGNMGRDKLTPRSRHEAKLKSKSWPRSNSPEEDGGVESGCDDKSYRAAPAGCFSVYVGSEKQRFVVKTECLNHPLFLKLLEEAESEYGFNNDGPLELPCEVDRFLNVLGEMDCDDNMSSCSFRRPYSSYHLLAPPKLLSFTKL